MNLAALPLGPLAPEVVPAIIEVPKGSMNKYEYDPRIEAFRLDRVLYSSVHYPGDYGFIPSTLADDGDPEDVLVLIDQPTFTGCVLEVRPLGMLKMADEKGPDIKIIAVPTGDPRFGHYHELSELRPHVLKEVEHFFKVYKQLEGKHSEVGGWFGREVAFAQIRAANGRFSPPPHWRSPAGER